MLQQMKCHALRRLDPHARQASQSLDQRFKRVGVGHIEVLGTELVRIRTEISCRRASRACRR